MRDLPLEIFKTVFQYLEQKDLQTCYFVCKSWYYMAIPLNWGEVTLQNSKIGLVISYLRHLDHSQYFKYGHLITKLIITHRKRSLHEISYEFSKLELLVLLSQLPNLKEIDISSTGYVKEYTGFLLDADLKHISEIDIGDFSRRFFDSYSYDLLFLVCYRFRDTISRVDLNYDKSTIHLNSQHINTLDSLTKFKKLTNLSIDNKHDINLTPFQVQDSCSNLEQLKFSSDYPISESVMLRRLSNNINLDFVASLKCLELELPSLSATYTRYLVDYFPNQLIDIDITISDQSPFSWIGSVGKELALGLMEKAGRVKGSFICFQQINRYEVQPNEESNMTKYFKLLNAFRGTRQIYCEAEFTEPNEVDTTDCVFHYFSCGKLYTTYCMHDNDFHGPDNADLDLPDKTSSMIGPEIFSSLEIAIWRKNTDLMYQSLKYSFLNCPKIESFGLNYDDSPYEQMSSYIKYTHKKKSPIGSYQPNFETNLLEMLYISPAQRYFDLVTTYLKDIEIMSFETLQWGRLHDDPVMNLTGFKKLKSFTYTTKGDNDSQDSDFVLLKFTNGEEQRYYLDEEKRKNAQVEYARNPTTTTPCITVFCDPTVSFNFKRS